MGCEDEDLVTRKVARLDDLFVRTTYYAFPDIHWLKIRTNNPLERIMREIRRRTRVACIPRWPVVPQPRRRTIALHRGDRMVRQMLHEHAAALSAAGRANRSRRLIE